MVACSCFFTCFCGCFCGIIIGPARTLIFLHLSYICSCKYGCMYLQNWFLSWLLLIVYFCARKKIYSREDNLISPPLKLGSKLISEKTWFHTIEYGSSNLSDSHVNVIFYYLRKISKYNANCKMRFTTTNTKFERKIVSIDDNSDSDDIVSNSSVKQDVLDEINGSFLPFSTLRMSVDIVLIPIWLPEQKHWLLAILNFCERELHVYSTLSIHGAAFHCLRCSRIIWTRLVFTQGPMLISLPSVIRFREELTTLDRSRHVAILVKHPDI
nr:PREDICTED: uncharacterized protein LOC108202198 isoform X2 [Daucus carota subsp. sativus]